MVCNDEWQVPNCYASAVGKEIYRLSHHLKKINGFLCLFALPIKSETMQEHPHIAIGIQFCNTYKMKSSEYMCLFPRATLSARLNKLTNFHAVPNSIQFSHKCKQSKCNSVRPEWDEKLFHVFFIPFSTLWIITIRAARQQ